MPFALWNTTAKVRATQLEPGDVLLSTAPDLAAFAVRRADGSRYSHAALYVGAKAVDEDPSVIEAVPPAVVRRSLRESVAAHPSYTDVYRYTGAQGLARQHAMLRVVQAAESRQGTPFAMTTVLFLALTTPAHRWLALGPLGEADRYRRRELVEHLRAAEGLATEHAVTCAELVTLSFREALGRCASGAMRAAEHSDSLETIRARGLSARGTLSDTEWPAFAVTPHDLSRAPELSLVGRLTGVAAPEACEQAPPMVERVRLDPRAQATVAQLREQRAHPAGGAESRARGPELRAG